jgi:preprotein translocase subunit SecD
MLCLSIVAGCGGAETEVEKVALELRIVETSPGEGLTAMTMTAWGRSETFYAHEEILMTGDDVDSAALTEWNGHPAVELSFTAEGAAKLAQITGANVGRRMGMIVDGVLVTAPVIRAPIDGGVAVINGEFTDEEAKRVAAGLGK